MPADFPLAICRCPSCGLEQSLLFWHFPLRCCGWIWHTPGESPEKITHAGEQSQARFPCLKRGCWKDLSNLTLCVTHYKRPDSLERLLYSIVHYWPMATVLLDDTGGNLSASRNRLVRRAQTKYVAILEDDFEFEDTTSLLQLVDVLRSDRNTGIAAGTLRLDGWPVEYAHDLRLFRGVMQVSPAADRWRMTRRGVSYRYCDIAFNWFVARRRTLLENPWDESLEVGEHLPFFWMLKQQQMWRVAYVPSAFIKHHNEEASPDYELQRNRAAEFIRLWQPKYGIRRTAYQTSQRQAVRRPNIVILGVGHANTSITTRQIGQLGWKLGDADAEFTESVSVRQANKAAIDGKWDRAAAARSLRDLPEPWVIKDPRFLWTLSYWLEVIGPYRPLLVWVTKDSARVRESYASRGSGADRVADKEEEAAKRFAEWPYAKVQIAAEDIARAAALCDLGIMGYALTANHTTKDTPTNAV